MEGADGGDLARRLPAPYAAALALVRAGASDDAIATELDVDVAAVPALVRLAAAKLLDALGPDPAG